MQPDDLATTVEYVKRHGTDLDRARLRYLLYGEPAPDSVRDSFERSQRSDGGWAPPWSPEYSSIDATCFQMTLAGQAGIERYSPVLIDGARFLIERQQFDGSWQEEESEAANAPPWAQPGDTAAHLYLTANAGLRLAVGGFVSAAARDAAEFLLTRRDEDGRLPSFPHTHWLAAALWHHAGLSDEASRTLSFLETQVAELSAGNLAWMITALCQAGLAADAPLPALALERLIVLRDPAGHWPADDGVGNGIHVTLEALMSLRFAGILP